MTLHCWFCWRSQHEAEQLFCAPEVPPRPQTLRELKETLGGDEAAIAEYARDLDPHPAAYICDRCVSDFMTLLKKL